MIFRHLGSPVGPCATLSDAQLAQRIGNPAGTRAVDAANGRNPLPSVLPCHRAIGADGTMTGFGGGVPTRQFLLRPQGVLPGGQGQQAHAKTGRLPSWPSTSARSSLPSMRPRSTMWSSAAWR